MKKRYTYIAFALATALLSCGCAKDDTPVSDGNHLKLSTSVIEAAESKATPVTSVKDFYAMGFNGTDQWFPTSGTDPVRVQITSGSSKEYTDYVWVKGSKKTFYAYSNNIPGGVASASIAADGVTLDITSIPTAASDQVDITLGRYIGKGNDTGTAAINFFHPFAQVKFIAGAIVGIDAITGIELSGLYSEGSTKLSASTTTSQMTTATGSKTTVAEFQWQDRSGSAKSSQTFSASAPAKDSNLGEAFMLIPQNLATQNVKVTFSATIDGTPTKLTYKLTSGEFLAGATTTYAVNYEPSYGLEFSAPEITPWGEGVSAAPELTKCPEGALPGLFTVGAGPDGTEGTSDDKIVFFSKGNLQYRSTADGSGTDLSHRTTDGTKQGIWRFAEEQWHTVGDAGDHFGNVYETIGGTSQLCTNLTGWYPADNTSRGKYCGWIDMFRDFTSGYDNHDPWDAGSNYYGPGPNKHMLYGDPISGTDWDWGHYNAISNGGDTPGLWRTPVTGELDYLLTTRQNTNLTIGSVNHVNAVGAFVEDIAGIMIFPDGFSWPSGLEMRFTEGDIIIITDPDAYSTQNTDGGGQHHWNVSYSGTEFQQLENAGVLFLPECICWKLAGNAVGMPSSPGPVYGFYWESNGGALSTKSTKAPLIVGMRFQFYGYQGGDGYWRTFDMAYRIYAMSVRLVTDAN